MSATIGTGIYTLPDIGHILGIPYHKVHRWISKYWETELIQDFDSEYSWTDGKSRAVSFHTLIELVVFSQLSEAGLKPKGILNAHKELSKLFKTKFPFATARVVNNIGTDGNTIFFKQEQEGIFSLDGKRQFNLRFIVEFFKNIEFGSNDLAMRFWPRGKENNIVVDPRHHFGQPTIDGTNVVPESVFKMFQAGEKKDFIGYLYNLNEKQIEEAIAFCKTAA